MPKGKDGCNKLLDYSCLCKSVYTFAAWRVTLLWSYLPHLQFLNQNWRWGFISFKENIFIIVRNVTYLITKAQCTKLPATWCVKKLLLLIRGVSQFQSVFKFWNSILIQISMLFMNICQCKLKTPKQDDHTL